MVSLSFWCWSWISTEIWLHSFSSLSWVRSKVRKVFCSLSFKELLSKVIWLLTWDFDIFDEVEFIGNVVVTSVVIVVTFDDFVDNVDDEMIEVEELELKLELELEVLFDTS